MREFKVGDLVIFIDKVRSERWKNHRGISLYGKLAKIINIHIHKIDNTYLLEFKKFINGYDGYRIENNDNCLWCDQNEFTLAINHLKFKKWIKG